MGDVGGSYIGENLRHAGHLDPKVFTTRCTARKNGAHNKRDSPSTVVVQVRTNG